ERVTLRLQHAQKIGEATLESLPRKSCRRRTLCGRTLECRFASLRLAKADERVLGILQRIQNRRLVGRECNISLGARDADLCAHPAEVERGPGDARTYRVGLRIGTADIPPR